MNPAENTLRKIERRLIEVDLTSEREMRETLRELRNLTQSALEYRVVGFSNGMDYERGRYRTAKEAVNRGREMVSDHGPGKLRVSVYAPDGKRIADFSTHAITGEMKERVRV